MKAWQIFGIGIVVLVAALLLNTYESVLAGAAAVVMVTLVVSGFLLRPQREVFYLRTTVVFSKPDYLTSVEHDRIGIRVELVRLWLLFVPTFAALAFLIVTSAKGTTWRFSLLNDFWDTSYYILLALRIFVAIVIGILSAWVSERWVLRHAEACSADSLSAMAGRILYSFRDRKGEYYGGEAFPFGLVRPPQLARIVFYSARKPQLSKISKGCLFHRPVVIGRGLTDLDEATFATRVIEVQPARDGA